MFNYFNVYDFPLFFDDKKLIQEIEEDESNIPAPSETLNQIFLLSQETEKIKLNIENCKQLTVSSAYKLLELIFNIVQNNKKYTINKNWSIYKGEYALITFDYHPTIVAKVQKLKSSKFHYEKKEWTIHISEWRELQKIFSITNFELEQLYLSWKVKNSKNKLLITEKTCQLLGNNLPIDTLYQENSFEDATAKHKISFKKGNWDGKIALFDINTRMFPIGILPKVIDILNYYNIHYEVIDYRELPTKKFSFEENVKLRDYQEYVVDKAITARSGILQLATGAGKTKIACSITSRLGLKTIFFVHTHFLLNQAKKELEKVLNTKIGQIGDGVIDIKDVTVAMIQTTMKALGEEYIPSIDDAEDLNEEDNTDISGKEETIKQLLQDVNVVFFDECQFVAAESFYTVANSCNAYYKYGLSATPYRSDKKDPMIIAALGPIIAKVSASYLIKRGFLTKPKIHFFKNGQTYYDDKRKYQTIYRENVVEDIERNNKIVFATKRLIAKNRSVLILVQQINHGEILQKMFANENIKVEFVSGINDTKKRELEVAKLKNKQSLCLIASTIADEGLDIPSLDSVILAGAGKSPSKELQRVGRALRKFTKESIIYETETLLKNNPHLTFGINCNIEWQEKIRTEIKFKNYIFINDKEIADKYIYINRETPIDTNNDHFDITILDNETDIPKGLVFCKTKKDMQEIKKICKSLNKTFTLSDTIKKVSEDICIVQVTNIKEDILTASKLYKNISVFNITLEEKDLEKEYFIFNEKNESFIVDFQDNAKYLCNHSAERYYMLKTENEFDISGYN